MTNGNLFLLITNELAQQTLDAITFPLKITVPDQAIETEGYSLGEAGVEFADGTGSDLYSDAYKAAAGFDDDIDKTAVLLRNGQTDADDEDIELYNAYKVDSDYSPTAEPKNRKLGKLKKKLLTPFKKLLTIELLWVKLAIDKPGFVLGDPILITDMVVRLQVKFRACGTLFGKKLTKTFTTEWMTLEARQLTLVLQTGGAKVRILPTFADLDVVLNFSMFGFAFTSQPAITPIINKQLHKRGPIEILDLSSFEKALPFSASKLGISAIAFAPDPKGLIINMAMAIV
jgi:hypothetical protein